MPNKTNHKRNMKKKPSQRYYNPKNREDRKTTGNTIDGRPYRDFDSEHSNNPAWYNKNPNQYANATKVPTWANIQGAPYAAGKTIPAYVTGATVPRTAVNTFPGAMSVKYLPTVGISKSPESAMNKAFNSLMSELYARTSGSSLEFTQASLAYLIISMASVASLTAAVKRMLGMKDFWITRNINYPRTISRAVGNEDYDDMIRNYNEYCNRLNDQISLINSIKMPAWFDIFARQYALNNNVYLDEDSDFGQIFVYMPEAIWKYSFEENKVILRSLIDCKRVSDYLDVIDECLGVWVNTSELYKINGALLRAFKEASFIFIEPFVEGTQVKPTTDEYLSMQLMNATVNGDLSMFISFMQHWEVTEDVEQNAIIFAPYNDISVSENDAIAEQDPEAVLMRCYKDAPVPDDNMEMTRLTAIYSVKRTGEVDSSTSEPIIRIALDSCGTEVVTYLRIFTNGEDEPYDVSNNVLQVGTGSEKYLARLIKYVSPFRFAPRMVIVYNDNGIQAAELGDQYNYCELSKTDLNMLHTTALYSIWKPNF